MAVVSSLVKHGVAHQVGCGLVGVEKRTDLIFPIDSLAVNPETLGTLADVVHCSLFGDSHLVCDVLITACLQEEPESDHLLRCWITALRLVLRHECAAFVFVEGVEDSSLEPDAVQMRMDSRNWVELDAFADFLVP